MKRIPCPDNDPGCVVIHYDPSPIRQQRMLLAGSIEDLINTYLHAFADMLMEDGYLTKEQAMESLTKFDESIQTTST